MAVATTFGQGVVRVLKRLYVLNGTLGDISIKLFHIKLSQALCGSLDGGAIRYKLC